MSKHVESEEAALLRKVGERAGVDSAEAARTLTAVVAAIASRLTYGEAHTLAGYLPGNSREPIVRALKPMGGTRFQPLGLLYDDVRMRLNLPPGEAPRRVAAVTAALAATLPPASISALVAQLPRFAGLFAPPPNPA